jgi:hypothetical protein
LSRPKVEVHTLVSSAYLKKMNERHAQGVQAGSLECDYSVGMPISNDGMLAE